MHLITFGPSERKAGLQESPSPLSVALPVSLACDGLWFLASALTNRRFLVEGYGYSSGKFETNGEMSSNQVVSLRFAKNPTELDAVKLWEMGIRWGWIDHEVNNPKDWNGLAKIVFNNSDISIVELIPSMMME